jgi:hypothetical protein
MHCEFVSVPLPAGALMGVTLRENSRTAPFSALPVGEGPRAAFRAALRSALIFRAVADPNPPFCPCPFREHPEGGAHRGLTPC